MNKCNNEYLRTAPNECKMDEIDTLVKSDAEILPKNLLIKFYLLHARDKLHF